MASLRCSNSASSVARSFLRIANRGYSTSTTLRTSAPLEFLLPRAMTKTDFHTSFPLHSSRHYRATCRSIRGPTVGQTSTRQSQQRNFTAAATRGATTCVLNPQTDEDGNQMMLEITPRAAKRLSEIMKKDKNANLALRIQVESGGCHGFQYLMSLVTIPAKDTAEYSTVVNDDDSIFQFAQDGEGSASSSWTDARIILDGPSLDLLKGSKVDFTTELIGSQFKIVDNPYATSSCGCGTSFDIKL
ncbi:hypothetical protein E4U60_000688 [Claviceps pazoutovae]|uniref:Core domain-containing protein n=1 Tax=Claviceps pazoutovae TaxID=1649127 RepID=A0A9P7SHA1_9HYPO|nr:hypothetical protein E4U60_000688 [Claviceps pazoutovae]